MVVPTCNLPAGDKQIPGAMLASLCSLFGEVQVQSDTLLGVGEGREQNLRDDPEVDFLCPSPPHTHTPCMCLCACRHAQKQIPCSSTPGTALADLGHDFVVTITL